MVIIKKLVVSMITLKTTVFAMMKKHIFVRERERRSLEVNDKL